MAILKFTFRQALFLCLFGSAGFAEGWVLLQPACPDLVGTRVLSERPPEALRSEISPKGTGPGQGDVLDIAEEIELPRTPAITDLFAPQGDLLVNALPENSQSSFFQYYFQNVRRSGWSSLKWSTSSVEIKEAVFAHLAEVVNFRKDRSIPYLSLRTSVEFQSPQNFKFLGKGYQKGEIATVNLAGFLLPTAEYAMSSNVATAADVEMHFRGKDPVELDRDIRAFFRYVLPNLTSLSARDHDVTPRADHSHIVAKKPANYIKAKKAEGHSDQTISDSLALYHSIVELNMIFRTVKLHENAALHEAYNRKGQPPLMSFLQRKKLPELFEFYKALVTNRSLTIDRYGEVGTALKKNHAGARWGSTYSDSSLWGIELRYMNYRKSDVLKPIAQAVKAVLDLQSFSFSNETLLRLERFRMQNELYDRIWFSTLPKENADAIVDPNLRTKAKRIAAEYAQHFVVKDDATSKVYSASLLILFDWSSHPLIANDPVRCDRIKTTQMRYFDYIIRSGIEHVSTWSFLEQSGLMETADLLLKNGGTLHVHP